MSFDAPKSEAPVARFADVTPRRLRQPSWVSAQRTPANKLAHTPSLKPPKLPDEFVDAIRQELEGKTCSRPAAAAPAPQAVDSPAPNAHPAAPVYEPVIPKVDPHLNAAFQEAVELLSRTRSEIVEQTAGQIAELAITIARRVLAHELSLDPKLVLGLVNEGLSALGDWDRIVIRLGACFADAREALIERLGVAGKRCEIMVDPALGQHGCVIETELGRVDESVEVRLATLLQALKPDSNAPPG